MDAELRTLIRDCINAEIVKKRDNPEQVARLEIAREYFTNPEFKQYLEDTVAEINGV